MKTFAILSLAISAASATYNSAVAPSGTVAAAAGAVTHTVTVGGVKPAADPSGTPTPILGYSPEAISAAVGDVVEFVFMQKNHTVTQSTFANPCVKMAGGIDSGFLPNPSGKPGVTFQMTVPATDPMWFYCKQKNGTHCGKGMVFSVNAVESSEKNSAAYKQLAIAQNGTGLLPANIAPSGGASAAQAPPASTVTIAAGASAAATIAAGQGQTGDGQACSCACLCGANSFPQAAAVNSFGGFAGMLS
ncbi:uncharacterized protein BDZ99DRAFT_30597 [Mytilinidion resinicola]|uniref:Cupredoxin n=1 Tax=Mytilinidion resinicola TaxID=574789 RepID=A0A6A6YLU1_9PEZI|nr:uncharacterized protein BDZ99DRAFT_30597 [Mytilinidion resinicola]KAF2809543.1 hypothetical protein BDZ99DRAFT_30597 [Mytilinidion resinicola]